MYIKLIDGNPEPYSLRQLRKDNPNVSFPEEPRAETLARYDVYPVTEKTPPEHNPLTENLVSTYTQVNGVWYKDWVVEAKTPEEAAQNLIYQVESDRYEKETGGVIWADANGETWFIDTKTTSQNRISGSVAAIQNNMRIENDVWKCAKINADGSFTLTYRPTTNADMLAWADLVFAHIQKCFIAESNAVTKIMQGDYTAAFDSEFELL